MPDSPRPSIAFPAFQTPAGLQPQADREHRSDYSETQGQARELNRRTDGYWLDLPYSASRYHGGIGTAAIVAVPKSSVVTARYKLSGADLILGLYLGGTISGADTVDIVVQLPERLRARNLAMSSFWCFSPAIGYLSALARIDAQHADLHIYRVDVQPWGLGSFQLAGQIVIEVEEV